MKYTCKICSKTDESNRWINGQKMLKDKLCFDCDFWVRHHEDDITNRKDHKFVIANGEHYVIEPEDSEDYFRGFGGAKVEIHFFDGTIVTSTNLWYNGEIPDRFRDIMPDNATIEWL